MLTAAESYTLPAWACTRYFAQALVALLSRPTLATAIVTLALLAIGGLAVRRYLRYAARDARGLRKHLRRTARRNDA